MKLPNSTAQGKLFVLGAGSRLFRLHASKLSGDQFNPGSGTSRFAPFKDENGRIIPTLYASTTFDGAAYETLFRERPAMYQAFPRQKLDDRAESRLLTTREVNLVALFTPELAAWNIKEEDLFTFDEGQYSLCRLPAAKIWNENPDADGMVWSSVRDSSANAMMLFEDRVAPGSLHVEKTRFVQSDADLLDELRRTATRAGIAIGR